MLTDRIEMLLQKLRRVDAVGSVLPAVLRTEELSIVTRLVLNKHLGQLPRV